MGSKTELSKETGELVLADIYNGRNMEGIQRGEIKKFWCSNNCPSRYTSRAAWNH